MWQAVMQASQIAGNAAKGSADQRMAQNQQALLRAAMLNSDNLGRAGLTSNNANTRASMQTDNAFNRASMQNTNATTRAGMQNSDNQFRAGLDLERKRFTQNEPSVQAGQALRGSMMSRIQPLTMGGMSDRFNQSMPKMNSLIDAIGPEARQAGSLLAQRGLSGLQSGPSKFADIPDVSLPDVTLPDVTLPDVLNLPAQEIAKLQKAGLLEKILGAIGVIGGGMSGFSGGGARTDGTV